MKTIVVIPTYNEVQHIEKLISQILHFQPELDILVVDDNSPDGTGKVVDELAKKSNKIKILHRPRKTGLGKAYLAGFKYTISQIPAYDKIIQMDADFSHHPKYLADLLEATENKDFSIGSRYIPGGKIINWNLYRKILSFTANFYVHLWLKLNAKDCTSGFRCFRRKTLTDIKLDTIKSTGYLFQIEILNRCLRLGCSFKEIPITFIERREGKTKLGLNEIWKAIWGIPKLWSINNLPPFRKQRKN